MPTPKDYTDKLTKWVVSKGVEQPERSFPTRLLVAGIVTVVACALLGILYYRSWKLGKEIAKLMHERDIALEAERQAHAALKSRTGRRKIDELIAKYMLTRRESVTVENSLARAEAAQDAAEKKIDAIQSWDEVDLYLADRNRDRGD